MREEQPGDFLGQVKAAPLAEASRNKEIDFNTMPC